MDPKYVHAKNETSCLNDLTFYFGTSSRWNWTRHQKKGDTICICFYVIQQRETNDYIWRL